MTVNSNETKISLVLSLAGGQAFRFTVDRHGRTRDPFKVERMKFNDYKPETKSFLETLIKHGFELIECDDGGNLFHFTGDMDRFVADLTACDESRLYVKAKDGKRCGIYLVFGNEPGVLPADYTCHDDLDKATEEHYNRWENKPQPTVEA